MLTPTYLVTSRFGTQKFKAALVGALVAFMVIVGSLDYEVERGDTLNEIAAEFGVSVAAIMKANDITDADVIRVGQILVIPGQDGGTERVHLVAAGDTLNSIAASYNTRAATIADINDIADINLIRIGQQLRIPRDSGGGQEQGGGGGGSSSELPEYHVVKSGETLGRIAARYGMSVSVLAEINGITNTGLIYVGQRLALSGTPYVGGGSSDEVTHTVAPGDTVGRIAVTYGVSVSAIVEANSLSNPNSIRVGQKLRIPGASADWICPVAGANYINDWGFPRSDERAHQGTDLFAPRGSKVRAPVGGKVTLINGTVGGFQFRLYGNDGVTYIGSHLDAFGLSDQVSAGDVIGYVGDSGNASGGPTHLHFEMHPGDGAAVNPFPTLQKFGC